MKVTAIMGDSIYCRRATEILEGLYKENPQYKKIELVILDENKDVDKIREFNYMLAPAFFIGNRIAFCGLPTKNGIDNVFKRAMKL